MDMMREKMYEVKPQNKCQCRNAGNSSNYPDEINRMPIGMAYVPWQTWKCVYDAEKGIQSGTIFPELEMPFYGARGACEMGGDPSWK